MQILLEAQVALGGLDRGIPQGGLDLLERLAAEMGELGEGAPQIMLLVSKLIRTFSTIPKGCRRTSLVAVVLASGM